MNEGLRFNCPHCDIADMGLETGLWHLKEKHRDCWSCKVEQMLISHLLECWEPEGTCHWTRPVLTAKA